MKISKAVPLLFLTLAVKTYSLKADEKNCTPPPAQKPNILFIMVDDLGYADVSFNKGDIPTPNIDALANGGAKLASMYTLPLCTPSRAALMTGRYPMRFGLESFVITPKQKYGLPLDERTLANGMKDAGYKTHMIGKWHLGHGHEKYWPTNRGFDHFKGTLMSSADYWTKMRAGRLDWYTDDQAIYEKGYITDLMTEEADRVIRNHDTNSDPLFMYLAYLAVHSPYQAKIEHLKNFTHVDDEIRKIYSAMVISVDESIGKIVRALEEKGMRENTLIVFSSDNGGLVKYPGIVGVVNGGKKPTPARNTPYRGGKFTLFEGGIRVASFANWPGQIPSGRVVTEMVHMVDWFPTLLSLAGVDAFSEQSETHPLDGKNIWNVLTKEEKSPHEELLINSEWFRGAIRWKNYKLIQHPSGRISLFDIEKDPSETQNIAGEFPEIVEKLKNRLNEYSKERKGSLFFNEYLPHVMLQRWLGMEIDT